MPQAYFMIGLGSMNCLMSQTRLIGVFDIPRREARCKICGIYEHELMEVSVDEIVGDPVCNCMSCNGWWHESCMSATDRQTLPSVLIANVEDGAAPPWPVEMPRVCEEGPVRGAAGASAGGGPR
jgi:hypothetical protein